MEFIVSNVLWFLAAAVVFALLAIGGQIRNIYRVTKMGDKMLAKSMDFSKSDLSKPLDFSGIGKQTRGMLLGFIPVAICGLGAAVCFVLFIVGVIGYFVK